MSEAAVTFACLGSRLVGVLHLPHIEPTIGMVLVVGGPQYRVGSHRQFVLMARHLAAKGVAVLRFDCRGMGDSEGEFPGFEAIDPDIAAATDFFVKQVPSITTLTLWGLCDAATAICFYAAKDRRIRGLALLNPWVRSDSGYARTQLKHYYLARLTDKDLLKKVVSGKFELRKSLGSLAASIGRAAARPVRAEAADNDAKTQAAVIPLASRMATALTTSPGKILLIMSGRDLTAKEFDGAAAASRQWRRILSPTRSLRCDLAEADHTFSRQRWRDQVAQWTEAWLKELAAKKVDFVPNSGRRAEGIVGKLPHID